MRGFVVILIAVLLFGGVISESNAQGSGNTLNFDGTNDYVNLPANPVSTYTNFTIETWVFWNSSNTWERIFDFGTGTTRNMFLTPKSSSGFPRFAITTSGNSGEKQINTTSALSTNVWHHFAVTYNASTTTGIMYIDGVQAGTNTTLNISPSTVGATTNNWIGRSQYAADAYFRGKIDEFRIWNTTRTATEVRNSMCSQLVGNETGLMAYYKINETSGTSLANSSSNAGAIANATIAASPSNPAFALSGAPIGDVSSYNYPGSWTGQSVSLTSPGNGNISINTVSGSPGGIHLYRVDAVPNTVSGITGVGNNDVYYGVFVANGSSPTYTVVYDYAGYPDALVNESTDALFMRVDNSVSSWSNVGATLNTGANTLTKTGVNSREEFMLGNTVVPLPLEIISFKAISSGDNSTALMWIVKDEAKVRYYEVEKSFDGDVFESIAIVNVSENNGNYQYLDEVSGGTAYYRLKVVSQEEEVRYSTIVTKASSLGVVSFYPVPFSDYLTVAQLEKGSAVEIMDLNGHSLYNRSIDQNLITIETDFLASGSYILQVKSSTTTFTEKILKY